MSAEGSAPQPPILGALDGAAATRTAATATAALAQTANAATPHRDVYDGPLLLVLSGPSGAGKDAVRDELRRRGHPFHFVVTATTRDPRDDERPEVDYHFLTPDAFQQLIQRGEFLEWEHYVQGDYGSPRAEVEAALAGGQDVLMRVDVRGALTIKRLAPAAVSIFVRPPSIEALRARMLARGSETAESTERRLQFAQRELSQEPAFDYSVLNADGELSRAVDQVEAIVAAEHCRVGRGPVVIGNALSATRAELS